MITLTKLMIIEFIIKFIRRSFRPMYLDIAVGQWLFGSSCEKPQLLTQDKSRGLVLQPEGLSIGLAVAPAAIQEVVWHSIRIHPDQPRKDSIGISESAASYGVDECHDSRSNLV